MDFDDKLKPCRFCGKYPIIECCLSQFSDCQYQIFCSCGAKTKKSFNKKEIINNWNRWAENGETD